MFRKTALCFLASLALGSLGLAETPTPTPTAPANGAPTNSAASTAMAPAPAPAEVTPEAVLNKIHDINQMEIQMGRLAKEQAGNKKVKKYGERMIKDHSKADKETMKTAKKDNIAVAEPTHDAADMAEMDKLKSLHGVDFDGEFLKAMQDGHDKAIAYLSDAEGKLSDSKTKKLVQKLLPTIREHRDLAVKLQQGR